MITGQHDWTLGVWIGLPIAVLFLLLCITIMGAMFSKDSDVRAVGFVALAGFLVTVGITVLCWYPFGPVTEYHAWNEVKGTVETTNKRLVSAGSDHGMQERIVVKFKESETLYGCDDTRCSLAQPGKTVRLICKREYEFRSVSGWVCRYGQEN